MKNWVNKEPLLLHELVYKRFSFSPTSFHVVNKKVANLLIKKGNISVDIIPIAIFYMSVYTIKTLKSQTLLCIFPSTAYNPVLCLELTVTKSWLTESMIEFPRFTGKGTEMKYFAQVKQWVKSLAGAKPTILQHHGFLPTLP